MKNQTGLNKYIVTKLYNMKKIIILLLPILISCGSIKKLKKKETAKSDSTSSIKIDSTSTTKTVSSFTTIESIDTAFQGTKDSAQADSKLSDLQKGDTSIVNTGTIEIKNFIDKKTGKLHTQVNTKPKPIQEKFNRTTIGNKTEDKKTSVKKEAKISVKKSESKSSVDKSRDGGGTKTGVIITLSILLLLILLYIIIRRKMRGISKYFP